MKTGITITRTAFRLFAAAAALGFALAGCGGGGGGGGGSTTSSPTVEVIVNPGTSPTANAGAAATYNGGETAMLDGTGSTDADGDPLRYTWTQTGGTNTVQLSDIHAARPVFEVPNANDTLTFSLVANDGYSNSAPASVTITTQAYAGPSLSGLTNSPFRGNLSWPSGSARAGISGNFAFVPANANGIAAVDITNPTALVQVGTYTGTTSYNAYELAIIGNYAYYTNSGSLGIVNVYAANIATPATMTLSNLVMSYTATSFNHLAVAGTTLYVADDSLHVQSVAAGPPGTPGATVSLPVAAQDIAVSGNYAYVADGASGLQIVDVTNATAATPSASIIGSYVTAAPAQAVAASGSYAYVAQGTSGLAVINVGTPASPTLAATIPAPGGVAVTHVDASGNYVFFSTDFDVWVYDVTTPASPVLAGEYRAGNLITGVKVSGSYAYITDTMGLRTIPIAKPSLPRGASLYTVAGPVREMRVYGDLGFVRTDSRVDILDLRNATAPTMLSTYTNTTKGIIEGMSLVDSFAYLSQGNALQLLRFRNPSTPDIAKSITACGTYAQTSVANDAYAYVYCNEYPNASVSMFDDSNPYTPVLRGSLASPYNNANWLREMAINGNQLYLSEANTGGTFRVADVSNPAAPTLVGGLSPTDLYGIAFRGNYVYSIGNNTGLKVVDVSNPATPTFAGTGYAQAGYTISLAATRAYVNSDFVGGGVKIIDTANPLAPTLAGELTPSGGADTPVVDGNYLYTFYSGPGGSELHATEREPILAARYVTGTVSSTLTYNVSWLDAAVGNDQQVTCRVTAGTCTVGTINQVNNTAPVSWTLPATAGDQEIEIAVGNGHYFNTTRDRVQVQ